MSLRGRRRLRFDDGGSGGFGLRGGVLLHLGRRRLLCLELGLGDLLRAARGSSLFSLFLSLSLSLSLGDADALLCTRRTPCLDLKEEKKETPEDRQVPRVRDRVDRGEDGGLRENDALSRRGERRARRRSGTRPAGGGSLSLPCYVSSRNTHHTQARFFFGRTTVGEVSFFAEFRVYEKTQSVPLKERKSRAESFPKNPAGRDSSEVERELGCADLEAALGLGRGRREPMSRHTN